MSYFKQEDINSKQIVFSINSSNYLKQCEIINKLDKKNIYDYLEEKVSQFYLFLHGQFHLGYKCSKIEKNKWNNQTVDQTIEKEVVLYTALPNDIIYKCSKIADQLDKQCVDIEPIALSVLRVLKTENKLNKRSPQIIMVIDKDYIDLSVIYNQDIIYSHVVRKSTKEIMQNEASMQCFVKVLNQWLLSFSDKYQELILSPSIICISRLSNVTVFLNQLASNLDFEIELHEFKYKVENAEIMHEDRAKDIDYLGAIGLAYKGLQPLDQTLSLIKSSHKQTLLTKVVWTKYIGAFVLCCLIILGVNYVISQSSKRLDQQIIIASQHEKTIQQSNFPQKSSAWQTGKQKLAYFLSIKHDHETKSIFLREFIKTIPEDITLTHINIKKLEIGYDVSIKAETMQMNAIHLFYDQLKINYEDVELKEIKSKPITSGAKINQFSLTFTWSSNDEY